MVNGVVGMILAGERRNYWEVLLSRGESYLGCYGRLGYGCGLLLGFADSNMD